MENYGVLGFFFTTKLSQSFMMGAQRKTCLVQADDLLNPNESGQCVVEF